MSESDNDIRSGLALLRKCCELASVSGDPDRVNEILQQKLKQLPEVPPCSASEKLPASEMEQLSEICLALSRNRTVSTYSFRSTGTENTGTDSAAGEREFLLALSVLSGSTEYRQQNEAREHLANALKYAPDDPRYTALAEILTQG